MFQFECPMTDNTLVKLGRLFGVVALVSLLVAVGLPSAVPAGASTERAEQPTEYIVTYRSGVDARGQAQTLRANGHRVSRVFTNAIDGVVVELTAREAATLQRNGGVLAVEPDAIVTIAAEQIDPTWGLDRSDQRSRSFDRRFSYPDSAGSGVAVYVIDTGVRPDHVDVAGRVTSGYTVISDGNGTNDCNGHGTHVAGTAAGTVWGMAKQASIVPVRVLGCNGSGTTSGVIAGMDWVAGHANGAAAVANLSLGGGASTAMDAAVASLHAAGVTVVVAAGNSNANACNYSPARAPDAVTVGATTSSDSRASYSNFGRCLDLFAPGSSITSAYHTSATATATLNGTSMAAPHVAGAAALLLSQRPALSPAEVATAIVADATGNVVGLAGSDSPNLLLYSDPTNLTPPPPPGPTPASITTTSLEAGTRNVFYSTTLTAAGGTGSHTWSLASESSLPAGLGLAANGTISGTPTTAQTSAFTVRVTDANALSSTAQLSLTIAAPVQVTTTTLAGGTTGTAYSATLAAAGGTGSYTWSLASGSLPAGLGLATNGTISGTPSTAQTSTFTVTATDAAGRTATSGSLSITVAQSTIAAPAMFGKSSPSNGATGRSRTSLTLSWQASTRAASYEVCVSLTTSCDANSTGWFNTGTSRSATVGGMAARTTYYWQVRALNAGGVTDANNATWWRFTTAR
jgi:subtilisin family serine protease